MARFPARLHILLARDAKTGVVIRRGPSKSVAVIEWDRKRDTFTLGQWLKGRLYELRADLSPDGKHLIYFAMNGHWSSRAKGSWTAISRAPYLTAVTLHAKGDCWNGGGLWVDNKHYWLNNGYGHTTLEDSGEVAIASGSPYRPAYGGECPGVYFNRLARDGWTLRPELALGARGSQVDVWEKSLGHGWTLRKLFNAMSGQPGKSVYFDQHELVGPAGELPRHDWEWADLDGSRLVWATGGCLHAGTITARSSKLADPITDTEMLHDFNDMAFEATPAPYATGGSKRTSRRTR